MSENGTYKWSPNTNKWKEASPKKVGKFIVLGILAVVLVIAGMTCFYTVDDKQQAVVTTLVRSQTLQIPVCTSSCPSASRRSILWT